jgi:replicative DNA helicase
LSEELAPRGRIIPRDDIAERSVIGALLQDPDRIVDAAETLRPEDFFDKRLGLVLEVCLDLSDRSVPIDIVSVGAALKAKGHLGEVGGHGALAQLSVAVSSSAHLNHHTSVVKKLALMRHLVAEATGIIDDVYETPPDQESVDELLNRSEQRIFDVGEQVGGGTAITMESAVKEAFKRLDANANRGQLTGLPSGFYELDDMLGGFNPGELTIIAARPSMGKTAFVLNLMERVALSRPDHFDHDPVVLFFSLEMGSQSIVQRMLCARGRVDAHKLRTGKIPNEDYADLVRAAGELQQSKIMIDDAPGLSIMAVRSRARRVARQYGLDMIVIDYLQLMTAGKKVESRQQEISLLSRSLKELARELKIPVIALSQLSRAVESREDKRPQLSDLRESGSIEQDADVVLMLYRAEYYFPSEETKNKAEIICAKQRNGPTGNVALQFFGNILRFENPEPSMAEPILP